VSSPHPNPANRAGAPARATDRLGRYSAPALEKGLDILELLAAEPAGLALKAIADRLGRSSSEIYRMLASLERRGYIRRDPPAETYHLTTRLFELAHQHPPTRQLLEAALPVMHEVARHTRQSCQLAVLDDAAQDRVLMIGQVDSPEPLGFSVRLGATFPIMETASGPVLLAFADKAVCDVALKRLTPAAERDAVARRLATIRNRGYERARSCVLAGIIDLSYPVFDYTGRAIAALTMPFVVRRHESRDTSDAQARLSDAVAHISRGIGGRA